MDASLLIVSSEDLPNPLFKLLEKAGFSCFYSRGVIKTRETLENNQIDAIVWLFIGHENALGKDLASVFNQHSKTPIVFITQNYEELGFAESIKGLFANLDQNEDLGDIVHTIETACSQSIIKEKQPVVEDTHEIEFRNVVSQIFRKSKNSNEQEKEVAGNKLQQVELWEAVDKNEKQILAGKNIDNDDKKKAILPKLKTLIKKT